MSKAALILRILFGLHFFVNGLNFYFHFFPVGGAMGPEARSFVQSLVTSGLIELVKVTEVLVGIALLTNRFVPLAAVLAMPVSVGIVYTDAVLIGGWLVGGVLGFGTLLLNLALILCYFSYFRPFLQPRSQPGLQRHGEPTA